MSTYLKRRIAERQTQIADLQRQIELVSAELRAYEDALAHSAEGGSAAEALMSNRSARLPPPPPSHWPGIIATLSRRGENFTIDDVMGELGVLRKNSSRKSVRAKLTDLVKEKKIQRLSDGVFTVPKEASAASASELEEAT
jgi:hypothetical protein